MRPCCLIALLFLAGGLFLSMPAARAQYNAAVPTEVARDPGYLGLTAGNVYIDPRLTGINQQTLEDAALQGDANPHTVVKIAMLYNLPANARDRSQYANAIHYYLGLDKNALIVVVLGPHARGGGVTVAAKELNTNQTRALVTQYVSQIKKDPTQGTAALAIAVAGAINGKEYSGSVIVWIVFFAIVAVVIGFIIVASNKKKKRLNISREPVEALRANVLSGIEYLDNYADVMPKGNAFTPQVLEMRQAASQHFDQATKVLSKATENSDLARAQILLTQAQGEIDRGRKYLDIVTGGTGNIPGDDALRPPPMPQSAAEALAVPMEQRGVSFFSGQPAAISSLMPVTITVAGQQKTVMATPEEALSLQNGQIPPVRSFGVNGNQVPWYAYNAYDPYRDYWTYQRSGWGGGDFVAGFIGAELLDSLFTPRYYGGWNSPYNFSPDYGFDHNYYGGQTDNFGMFGGGAGGYDQGFGGGGSGYDQPFGGTAVDSNDYGDSGFDPGNDPGNFDPGGGGVDPGSFDSGGGGGDFGGGDFGGGDSGGGGGDF